MPNWNTQNIGGSLSLRANGQGGSRAIVLAALFAKQKTKFGGGGTPVAERFAFATGQEARAGKNSLPAGRQAGRLPPNPLFTPRSFSEVGPFCPPELKSFSNAKHTIWLGD